MTHAPALDFFRENHRSVLATFRRDGRPHLVPVLHAVGDDGRVLISSRSRSDKVRNLLRDPRASVCATKDKFFGASAQIDGTAEIVEMPEAMGLLRFAYVQSAGEHPNWEEFEAHMLAQGRVAIAITPERSRPPTAG